MILLADITNKRQSTTVNVSAAKNNISLLLTEAGGFRGVPLAQFGAVGHVPALQDESGMAAVMKRGALHRWPRWLRHHPAVLQGNPHSRAQLHWKPVRHTVTQEK